MSYSKRDFDWCPPKIVSKKLIGEYIEHYKTLDDAVVVGILHEYMKEATRYGHIGAVSTASVIALVREVNRRQNGKFMGGTVEQNQFILDTCKIYKDLIYDNTECVSIW